MKSKYFHFIIYVELCLTIQKYLTTTEKEVDVEGSGRSMRGGGKAGSGGRTIGKIHKFDSTRTHQ